MKHEIKDIYGKTLFVADIPEGTESGMEVRVALAQAVRSYAYLGNVDLSNTNLRNADLSGANLSDAYLMGANLRNANLRNANLSDADMSDANLRGADLNYADLRDAILIYANLNYANLRDADMRCADLSDADMRCADLRNADLSGADLMDTIGNSREIKTIQTDRWIVSYTKTHMQIGCQNHSIERWFSFSDSVIDKMDRDALAWWNKHRNLLKDFIELSPAKGKS